VHTVLFPSQAEDLIRADARYSYTAIDPDIEEKLAAERSELAAPAVAVAAELWDAAIFGVMDLLSKESEAAPALAEVVMAEELEEVKEVEASLTTLASDDSVDDPALGHGGFLIKVGHGYTHPPKKCYFVFDQSNGAVYYYKSQKDGLLGTNVLGKLEEVVDVRDVPDKPFEFYFVSMARCELHVRALKLADKETWRSQCMQARRVPN